MARPCLKQLQLCGAGRVSTGGGRWSFPAHWSARHRTRQNGDGPPAGYGRGGTAGGAWKSKGKKQVAGDWHCNFHNNSNSDLGPCEGRWRAEGWSNNTCECQGHSGAQHRKWQARTQLLVTMSWSVKSPISWSPCGSTMDIRLWDRLHISAIRLAKVLNHDKSVLSLIMWGWNLRLDQSAGVKIQALLSEAPYLLL